MKNELLARGAPDSNWENQQLATLSPPDCALYEQIMDDTFRSLR